MPSSSSEFLAGHTFTIFLFPDSPHFPAILTSIQMKTEKKNAKNDKHNYKWIA